MSFLQHVALEVREADIEAEVAFWALLGFDRVAPPGALAERSAWVQARDGETQVHLMFADAPVVPPAAHAAVVVGGYAAVLDALRTAGFTPEPREQHWGAARAFVLSPAGHRVEVMPVPPSARGGAAHP